MSGKKKTVKGTKEVVVQSVVFEKQKWKEDDAKKWLKSHGMRYAKVDKTPNMIRFRQQEPNKNGMYRTKQLPCGVDLVMMR